MKFNAALPILSSLVVLAGAFKPEADGVYEVTINSDGKIIDGELVGNVTSTGALERRDIPDPATRCLGYGINGNDYVVAFNSINSWCDSGNRIAVGQGIVTKYGASAAIICNFASGTQPCGSGENKQFNTLLDISCGSGAGWVWVGQWGKTYGRDTSGTVQCR